MNIHHDEKGKFASADNSGGARAVVTQHGKQRSVHGRAHVPPIGSKVAGPGFTISRRTGRAVTKGVAVAGGDSGGGGGSSLAGLGGQRDPRKMKRSMMAVGGGEGWMTEAVNIAREQTLGKNMGRMQQQMGVFDLSKKEFIPTGGKTDPAVEAAKRHKAA